MLAGRPWAILIVPGRIGLLDQTSISLIPSGVSPYGEAPQTCRELTSFFAGAVLLDSTTHQAWK